MLRFDANGPSAAHRYLSWIKCRDSAAIRRLGRSICALLLAAPAASTASAQAVVLNDGVNVAPKVAISRLEDWPASKAKKRSDAPILWPPVNVDAAVPPIAPGVSCPLDTVLKGARLRVQELLENVDRFTATEVIDTAEIGADGRARRYMKYNFNYLAAVSQAKDGDLRFDESRKQTGKINSTPIPIRTVGLSVGAVVFHPLRYNDFEMTCEGLGQWRGKPAWQLRFAQRHDKRPRIQAIFDNGHWFDVKLKGRAWIAPENSQIEHLDFDLLETVQPIRLLTEHMSVDYHAVDFAKRNIQLWLPESVNFYIDISGHRYVNRHRFTDFLLFAVDTSQEIHPPKIDPN